MDPSVVFSSLATGESQAGITADNQGNEPRSGVVADRNCCSSETGHNPQAGRCCGDVTGANGGGYSSSGAEVQIGLQIEEEMVAAVAGMGLSGQEDSHPLALGGLRQGQGQGQGQEQGGRRSDPVESDAFETLLFLEESFFREGVAQGMEDGGRQGQHEGGYMGVSQGFALGKEVGGTGCTPRPSLPHPHPHPPPSPSSDQPSAPSPPPLPPKPQWQSQPQFAT